MNANITFAEARTFLSAAVPPNARKPSGWSLLLLSAFCLLLPSFPSRAGLFSGNASVGITDTTGGLSWISSTNLLTVQCWFKLSIPSGVTPTANMTILVNRTSSGDTNTPHAYNLWWDYRANNIQFSTRSSSSNAWQGILIPRPYLDRWYHVAVVRNGVTLTAFVDGQVVTTGTVTGDTRSTNGVSIGGWGNANYLYGEVQEVSIYDADLSTAISALMFVDQKTNVLSLRGYYKLGYSTNAADYYRNFAMAKPAGTDPAAPAGPGQILFEETDQKGEQSSFDATVDGGKNAIVPLSGAFAWRHSAFSRPAPGVPFDFSIAYSPGATGGALGPGWSHSFETKITVPTATSSNLTLYVNNWQGGFDTWDITNNIALVPWSTRDKEYRGELTEDRNNNVFWTNAQRQIYRFRNPGSGALGGALAGISDLNGNLMQFLWDEEPTDPGYLRIANVVDSAGGNYTFGYNSLHNLASVTYSNWQVLFGYDTSNRLASKTLTNTSGLYTRVAATWRFYYNTNSGLLEKIVNPGGNTEAYVQYDAYGRRVKTFDALGNATSLEYGVPGNRQIRTTDAEGFQWIDTYDRDGRVIAQRDPLAHETHYAYDAQGNRTATTDPNGNTTRLGYDERGNIIAQTNALGEITRRTFHPFFNKPSGQTNALGWVTSFQYDAAGNLINMSDDLGRVLSCTYTTNGLALTATDANGHTTANTYDVNTWFVIAQTDAAGFTTQFTPNELGWKLAAVNPLGETTTYSYDINGKVVLTVDALSRAYAATYDPNGNLLTQTDAKGQLTSYAYDGLNRKTNKVDRAGAVTQYTYTPRGKVATRINPLNQTTTFRYDAANRLTSTVDAAGNVTSTVYDATGNPVARIDPLGRRWSKAVDRLNRVVAASDPLGNTTQTLYDPAGRVRETIAPNGSLTFNAYDGRGRLTNWVDAAGSNWRYDYDGAGNITNMTDALGGHYVMVYSNRNERILERNQDTNVWRYTYDELLRVKTQTDPNGTKRTLEYDAGGRLIYLSFNTGRIDTFFYDDNDNPTSLSRTGSGPLTSSQLDYDPMDRLQFYRDTFGKSLRYAYDPAGRLATLTYPDGKTLSQGYDVLDRLTNQVFQFGLQAFTTSYAYDQAGQLIRRAYPNGIVQTNSFDRAGRRTGLSHCPLSPQPSAVNLALAYAYDRNGNTIRSQGQGLFQWPKPALLDETSRFTAAGRITNRVDALTPTNHFTYQYDASGNMTNAVGGGQNWTLTYDEDNRTTSITWDPGITGKIITNRFDALGRRIARTVDRVETRYVLDLLGNMERVLCDVTTNGVITAWYVHGADLSFKVATNGSLTCYHADAQGNIIALSGANGTNLIEYAYTPYGRSLGSTNYLADSSLDTQPFLFGGSQGAMLEEQGLPGLYFMRARYYSADAGVFLSTDPVKNIGPSWRPNAYAYAKGNPLKYSDPKGEGLLGAGLVAIAAGDMEYMIFTGQAEPSDYLLYGMALFAASDPTDVSGVAVLIVTTGLEIFEGKGFGGLAREGAVAAYDWTRDKAVPGLENAWKATESGVETAWNKTESGVETGWNKVESGVETGWKKTESGVETAWNKTESAVETAWNKTESGVETAGKTIESGVETAGKTIASGLETAGKDVGNAFKSGWNTFKSWF